MCQGIHHVHMCAVLVELGPSCLPVMRLVDRSLFLVAEGAVLGSACAAELPSPQVDQEMAFWGRLARLAGPTMAACLFQVQTFQELAAIVTSMLPS